MSSSRTANPLPSLDLVVAKSGSETATLFAQKHLDMGIASITAIMAGIDKGTPMKIVCPLQTEGMALVVPRDSSLTSWESLLQRVKESKGTCQDRLPFAYQRPQDRAGRRAGQSRAQGDA